MPLIKTHAKSPILSKSAAYIPEISVTWNVCDVCYIGEGLNVTQIATQINLFCANKRAYPFSVYNSIALHLYYCITDTCRSINEEFLGELPPFADMQ